MLKRIVRVSLLTLGFGLLIVSYNNCWSGSQINLGGGSGTQYPVYYSTDAGNPMSETKQVFSRKFGFGLGTEVFGQGLCEIVTRCSLGKISPEACSNELDTNEMLSQILPPNEPRLIQSFKSLRESEIDDVIFADFEVATKLANVYAALPCSDPGVPNFESEGLRGIRGLIDNTIGPNLGGGTSFDYESGFLYPIGLLGNFKDGANYLQWVRDGIKGHSLKFSTQIQLSIGLKAKPQVMAGRTYVFSFLVKTSHPSLSFGVFTWFNSVGIYNNSPPIKTEVEGSPDLSKISVSVTVPSTYKDQVVKLNIYITGLGNGQALIDNFELIDTADNSNHIPWGSFEDNPFNFIERK